MSGSGETSWRRAERVRDLRVAEYVAPPSAHSAGCQRVTASTTSSWPSELALLAEGARGAERLEAQRDHEPVRPVRGAQRRGVERERRRARALGAVDLEVVAGHDDQPAGTARRRRAGRDGAPQPRPGASRSVCISKSCSPVPSAAGPRVGDLVGRAGVEELAAAAVGGLAGRRLERHVDVLVAVGVGDERLERVDQRGAVADLPGRRLRRRRGSRRGRRRTGTARASGRSGSSPQHCMICR